jgi:hypothetical protein
MSSIQIKMNPNVPEKELIKKIIKYKMETEELKNLENNKNYLFNNFTKYKVIKNIPKLFVLFLIILIILIISSVNISDNTYLKIINHTIPLITGITVVIAGIYLWTVRKEWHIMVKDIINKKMQLYQYAKDDELLNMYDDIEKNTN